jgi:hypothetical protein
MLTGKTDSLAHIHLFLGSSDTNPATSQIQVLAKLTPKGILGGLTSSLRKPLRCQVRNLQLLAADSGLWETVFMSEKRTKADKAQREADLLDEKSSHRPPQNQGKKPREDFNQAAVRIVEEAAEKD